MKDTRLTLSEVKGPLDDLNEKLVSENGREWLYSLNRFLRKENPWEKIRKRLLESLGTVIVPATKKKFVVRKKFVVDTSDKAKVKISYLSYNFKNWFLNKIEEPIEETELQYNRLKERSVDEPIIAELGGKEKAETSLTEVFSLMLMEKQKNGEDGVLLNNEYANIFYVRDSTQVLRAVCAYWYEDGWNVHAYTVEDPDRWHDGHRVFSRNS